MSLTGKFRDDQPPQIVTLSAGTWRTYVFSPPTLPDSFRDKSHCPSHSNREETEYLVEIRSESRVHPVVLNSIELSKYKI